MNDELVGHKAVRTGSSRIGTIAAAIVWVAVTGSMFAQTNALRILVLEGEDAVNIVDKKTAVKPTVEVRDRNDLPAAGAVVLFAVRGRGATFANGARQLSVTTDSLGRATVSELTPIGKGTVEIQVSANYQGQAATATIHQTNFATAAEAAKAGKMPAQSGQSATSGSSGTTTATTTAGAAGGAGGGLSGLAIAGIVGGAAAGTAVAVAVARGGNKPPTVTGVTATPAIALQSATTVAFSAQAADPEGDALSYSWDFGDGGTATDAAPTHLFSTTGSFTVRLTVRDANSSTTGQTVVTVRSLTGTWSGTTVGSQFGDITEVYTLTQSGTAITGGVAASTGADGGTFPAGPIANGSIRPTSPRITFTVTHTGFIPYTFTGDPSADLNTLTGVFNGSGYSNQQVTVARR